MRLNAVRTIAASIIVMTVSISPVSTVGSSIDGSIESINEALADGNVGNVANLNRRTALSLDSLPFRLHHARELLGKFYNKSVVRVGEHVLDIHEFVSAKVEESLHGKWKKKSEQVAEAILTESNRYHFDPMFLVAVIQNESSFSTDIVGLFGEIGLMQIKPTTAKWVAKIRKLPWMGAKSLKNPVVNIQIGSALLDMLREKFDHGRLYLSAYNMGASNVRRALKKQVWPREYSERVMQHYIALYRELADDVENEMKVTPSETVAEVYPSSSNFGNFGRPGSLPVYKE